MLAFITTVLPVFMQLVLGFFDDKPNIKKALLIGASMAQTGVEGWSRFASIAEKIKTLAPGTDFTDEDLEKMSVGRDQVLSDFDRMLEKRKEDSAT